MLPENNDSPKLTITPEGVTTYHALRRNKQFVTLHYRKDKPVQLVTMNKWVAAVLDDIAQADLLVRGGITHLLSPETINTVNSGSQFTGSLKIDVQPRSEEVQEKAEWVEELREYFARKSD